MFTIKARLGFLVVAVLFVFIYSIFIKALELESQKRIRDKFIFYFYRFIFIYHIYPKMKTITTVSQLKPGDRDGPVKSPDF